jgi:hypothetical protein
VPAAAEAKVADCEARREDREGGRRGVAGWGGRGVRVREGVREPGRVVGVDMLWLFDGELDG